MATSQQQPQHQWHRMKISHVEDLSDAVRGAGMDATQMNNDRVSGSLVFSEGGGISFSGGLINGRVALRGPLSPNTLSLGVALRLPGPCWHWLTEVKTGDVGVFHGSDEHDALYTPGSLYVAATIPMDQLEHEAAKDDLVLNREALGGTGIHKRSMAPEIVSALAAEFAGIHAGRQPRIDLRNALLRAFINHLGRPPHDCERRTNPHLHARIVARARTYILDHLAEPIALDDIATAAFTSRRTLYRAFAEIFDDTPQNYVRRLRLHRIRQGLANEQEKVCTIAVVANQWGISELGRLAGWYREMFGELPSQTLASAKQDSTQEIEKLH